MTLKSLLNKSDRNVMKISRPRVIDLDEPYEVPEPMNDGALSSDISVDLAPDSEREFSPDEFEKQLKF